MWNKIKALSDIIWQWFIRPFNEATTGENAAEDGGGGTQESLDRD